MSPLKKSASDSEPTTTGRARETGSVKIWREGAVEKICAWLEKKRGGGRRDFLYWSRAW